MRNLWKRMLTLALASGVALSVQMSNTQAASSSQITVLLDDYPLVFDAQPTVIQGTTMVPFRAISEALGISVVWNQKQRTITAVKKEKGQTKQVVLTLGSKTAKVNNEAVSLAVAPTTIQNHTMVPLSFFSQQFGASVGWNQQTRTVSIQSPQEQLYTMGFYALSSFDERSYIPAFDSVAFGWSRLDNSGSFTTQGKEYRWPQAAGEITPESIIQDAANQGTSPYLMVFSGDGNLEITKNLQDKALQRETISQIVNTAVEKRFQGIVLDLEGLGWSGDKNKAKSEYVAFVAELTKEAHRAGLKVTVVMHPLNSAYAGYDYAALGQIADDLIIMAYAYEQEKSPEPMKKVDEAIRLALKETDSSKLILGISVASENETSIHSKIGLAKRYGLKGIAVWRLGLIGQPTWNQMNESLLMK